MANTKISSTIVGVSATVDGALVFSNAPVPGEKKSQEIEDAPNIKTETIQEQQKVVERGEITYGVAVKIDHPFIGKVYFKPFFNTNKQLVEVFVSISKQSPENIAQVGAISRLISTMLKHGVDVVEIVKHLKGTDAGQVVPVRFPGKEKSVFIKSIPDLIGNALEIYSDFDFVFKNFPLHSLEKDDEDVDEVELQDDTTISINIVSPDLSNTSYVPPEYACPECGSAMRNEGGCWVCSCGYSKCG